MDLKFTPGNGDALLCSAEKGISMLLCRPKTGKQVEIEKEQGKQEGERKHDGQDVYEIASAKR